MAASPQPLMPALPRAAEKLFAFSIPTIFLPRKKSRPFRSGNRVVSVLKENGGQSSAFNAGFAQGCGEIICFLDSDDIFAAEKVETIQIWKQSRFCLEGKWRPVLSL